MNYEGKAETKVVPSKRATTGAVVGALALTLLGVAHSVDENNRNASADAVTTESNIEHNLTQAVRDGLKPDDKGFLTVSDGKQDVKVKVRQEVLGNTPDRDTWSETLIADGVDPAKLPDALTAVTGEVSNNGSLAGSQAGEVAYVPDDLYLHDQPNQ